MDRTEPYRPRPIRPLTPIEDRGWRLKVYGISYGRQTPRTELEAAARAAIVRLLPTPAVTPDRYGVGFAGIHDGRGACFVFVDWWAAENELHHRVLISPADTPAALEFAPEAPIACAWDLAVICHERQAWVESVLVDPAGPDLDAYLGRLLDAEV
jgi:hypothetical protein